MKIAFVEIQNFRKLKACRIEIAQQETIFVGANNSGKTSAMDALILFIKQSRRFATTDFTLSNWRSLNKLGTEWVKTADDKESKLAVDAWLPLLPSIDVWLAADETDLHRVVHLLPTLDWTPEELLGIRLVFAPKNMERLYKGFRSAHKVARDTESASTDAKSPLPLWPASMKDFLDKDKQLHSQFEIQSYILDPTKRQDPVKGIAKPQSLPPNSNPIKKHPFDGLIKIDVINAQRGFSDPKTEDESHTGFASLSTQLRHYFSKHLNPSKSPDLRDIKALQAIEAAKTAFNETLETSFRPAIGELEGLNYPGFSDPTISITSEIDPRDSLDHEAAVKFDLLGEGSLSLPEKYNGLGYQNLISMVFNLIRFRDEWMRVGKAAENRNTEDISIEPLHLVLVEEPEAHLHAQVQQVFIKKGYEVLRNHNALEDSTFSTQMIVSTHSSYIAHELDFSCLRYFRRKPATNEEEIPTATVVNLSKTFGDCNETSKFATRFLRTTHCDLFFADAAILVEGSAERMLIPHFIREKFPALNQSYISLLEIGGAHAHRLEPLLDTLGLLSLVITDLDSIHETGTTKARPERDKGYRTGNTTLKDWVPKKVLLDELLDLPDDEKQTADGLVRVAYQCPVIVKYKEDEEDESDGDAIPYTFEDSLALTNLALFRRCAEPVGLLKKLQTALRKDTLEEACKAMFDNLEKGSKAEMALELLYWSEPDQLEPPSYITDGLKWLAKKLQERKVDAIATESREVNDV